MPSGVLSADSLSIAASTSSVSKGETLLDTAKNLEAMNPDLVVIRHAAAGAPHLLARHCRFAVVNAGDGAHEHPTQALLDALTLRQHKGKLEGLKVAIVGDILHSRVARSNLWLLSKMGAQVVLCGPPTVMPPGIEEIAPVTYSLEEAIEGADAIMMLRIQIERMSGSFFPTKREYFRRFGLTEERARRAKKDVLIMHPGPLNRGVEIASEVADGPYSVILDQVTNGVAIRMAVLYLLLGGSLGCGVMSRLLIRGGRVIDPSQGDRRNARRPDLGGHDRRDGAPSLRAGDKDRGREGPGRLPGLHRHPHPPARAGAGAQGDHRQRNAGRSGRRGSPPCAPCPTPSP